MTRIDHILVTQNIINRCKNIIILDDQRFFDTDHMIIGEFDFNLKIDDLFCNNSIQQNKYIISKPNKQNKHLWKKEYGKELNSLLLADELFSNIKELNVTKENIELISEKLNQILITAVNNTIR